MNKKELNAARRREMNAAALKRVPGVDQFIEQRLISEALQGKGSAPFPQLIEKILIGEAVRDLHRRRERETG